MQPHVTVECGYVLELPVTQVAFDGLLFELGIAAAMVNDCGGDLRGLDIVS